MVIHSEKTRRLLGDSVVWARPCRLPELNVADVTTFVRRTSHVFRVSAVEDYVANIARKLEKRERLGGGRGSHVWNSWAWDVQNFVILFRSISD